MIQRLTWVTVILIGLVGCDLNPPNESTAMSDIDNLPSITETKAQMLALIDQVQHAVSTAVPDTRPWRWKDEWSSGNCTGDNADNDGVSLNFPNLVSSRSLTEVEWTRVFTTVKDIAATAGLTEYSSPHDSAGSHDIRFHSPDGRTLIVIARVATLISARIACRSEHGQRLERGPDGRIPMPPNPQP